jgi:phenylalanyl-tRNA synthetase beta chain
MLHGGIDIEIGKVGVVHPEVLTNFDIGYPCSALEFSLEPFKKQMPAMWTNDDI